MKTLIIRLSLSLSGGLFLILGLFLLGVQQTNEVAAYSPPTVGNLAPATTFHLWDINEIFSCADGSIQFVELFTTSGGQEFLSGRELRATNLAGSQTESFNFPGNSGSPTQNKTLLIATAGFDSLSGGVTPDFILPADFIFTDGGSVSLVGADTLSYGAGELPLDGVNSLGPGGATAINSPRNFAGQQGSITCPSPPTLSVSKQASPSTIQPNEAITFTLAVTSSGSVSNTNVVLTDTLPLNTTFLTATDAVSPINNVLTWTLGDMLPPLSVISRSFVVTSNAPVGTKIVNDSYGAHSDQTTATGAAVEVLIADQFIYLPIILK